MATRRRPGSGGGSGPCEPRTVLVDLAANLHKERLARWSSAVLEAANRELRAPGNLDEVQRYYRSNARLWEVMLGLRRADLFGGSARYGGALTRFLLPGPTRR